MIDFTKCNSLKEMSEMVLANPNDTSSKFNTRTIALVAEDYKKMLVSGKKYLQDELGPIVNGEFRKMTDMSINNIFAAKTNGIPLNYCANEAVFLIFTVSYMMAEDKTHRIEKYLP